MEYSVLYVDDNTVHQDVVRECAEFAGGITITAEPSAERALDMLASGSFDAVIECYDLKEMDGFSFLSEVRSRCGDLPFVFFFLHHHNPDIVAEAVRKGVVSVHLIPFSVKEFREIVRELTTAIMRRKGEAAPHESGHPR